MYKRPYRMAGKHLAELKDKIKELLEEGYIRPSSPPCGAPMIFIPKKDGTQRMCMYYHALNKVIVKDKYCCLGLMIYLIKSLVRVCFLESIFDGDRIS
jgi:hypothetical protein